MIYKKYNDYKDKYTFPNFTFFPNNRLPRFSKTDVIILAVFPACMLCWRDKRFF